MTETLNTEELDRFIQGLVAEDKFSGVVLIAKNNTPIFRKAYGLACKRFSVPNTLDTKFNIGSINKIFTKLAILQLAEQGKLTYEDLVGKFLAEFPPAIATKVTIRHLLTFTAGLGHYWNERFRAAIGTLRTVDDFVRLFIEEPLLFEPGERREYSNNCYVVLGKIIEAITGQSYYDYIREHIYTPAGMMDSDHYELDMPVHKMATGYTRQDPWAVNGPRTAVNAPRRNNVFLIGSKGSPAGGGYSTVDDLLRFDLAVQNNHLLSPESSGKVLRPVGAKEESTPRVIALAGGAPGVAAFFVRYPQIGYTVIILSNYDPDDAEVVEKKISTMLL
ncbi:MAG: serine hydrolase domain-containing protein, partial [Promethearchaeota archaeon]